MRLVDPVASRVPWMTAAGNHEIEAGSTLGGPFAAYEARFNMPSAGPAVRSLRCGTAGGLDGNESWCGAGANDQLALLAARQASEDGMFGDGVAKAALRARQAQKPWGEVISSGWSTDERGGGTGGGGGIGEWKGDPTAVGCAPSEWSGTYDYGNRYVRMRIRRFSY